MTVPATAGALSWFGTTRMAGPSINRNFSVAEAGQHRVVPKKIFPNGRVHTFRQRGYDLFRYEAADQSDSCLVWAGPYNEVTTWFGGPAPRVDVINRLVAMMTFTDSPSGATFRPGPEAALEQHATTVFARNDDVLFTMQDAQSARGQLPAWRGATVGGGELWKEPLDLEPAQRTELAGTPLEFRYKLASATAVVDIIFPVASGAEPEARSSAEARFHSVIQGVQVDWSK